MNTCKPFEKRIPGYLLGELYEGEYKALRAHLETCASCRAELEAQHRVLKLAGRSLASAPSPQRMVVRRSYSPKRINLRQGMFSKTWHSPQFKAVLATGVLASFFFFFSGLFVVFTVIPPPSPVFEPPPPVERPKMKLKKPALVVKKTSTPKPASRIVANVKMAKMPEIAIPDQIGTGEGLLGGVGGKTDSRQAGLGLDALSSSEMTKRFDVGNGDRGTAAGEELAFGAAMEVVADADMDFRAGYYLSDGARPTEFNIDLEGELLGGMDESGGREQYAGVDGDTADFSYYADPLAEQPIEKNRREGAEADKGVRLNRQEVALGGVVNGSAMSLFSGDTETYDMSVANELSSGLPSEADAMDDLFGESSASQAPMDDLFGESSASQAPMDDLFGESAESQVPMSDLFALSDSQPAVRNRRQPSTVAWSGEKELFADAAPVQDVRYEQGKALYEQGNYDAAAAVFEDVLAYDPDNRGAMNGLQHAATKVVEKEEAEWDAVRDKAMEELAAAGNREYAEPATPPRTRAPAEYNPYVMAAQNAFSTFSIDVDTASYGLARQQLFNGQLPDPEAVRTEEFINSFDYDYRPPVGEQTFAVHTEMAPSPFRARMDLLKIGIKGRRIGRDDHRGANLTLVIDTSGSMSSPERLGLVKRSLALLLDQLNPEDRVAIVQFGGDARLVSEHTPVGRKEELLAAINRLQAGGPTQFDQGLQLGYQMAVNGFVAGDSNRIIIMSDGVANLGELDPEAILAQVAEFRQQGIYLSVLGFGAGSYDDDLLERLANRGDGSYAYVDTMDEARRLFVEQLAATLHVIASDVKIQVEFNPARVLRYRQLGYENRQLTKEQFRDDSVDAGEVGSGQSVTALYDVELRPDGPANEPIATVYVRYRRADNQAIEEISSRVTDLVCVDRFEDANPRFQLAACVAEFAEKLRRSPYTEATETGEILDRLQPVIFALDLNDEVQELQRLLSVAASLAP